MAADMDFDDDFKFQPLSEGLGFHRKAKANKAASPVSTPLPRVARTNTGVGPGVQIPPTDSQVKVDEILKSLRDSRQNMEISEGHQKHQFTQSIRTSYFDLSAGFLDALLVISLVLCAFVGMMIFTPIDLVRNLMNPDQSQFVYLALVGTILVFCWIYLMTFRIFIGSTLGEWVVDQKVQGHNSSWSFLAKSAARSTLAIATGLILFPLASMLLQKDILGKWFGIELVKSN